MAPCVASAMIACGNTNTTKGCAVECTNLGTTDIKIGRVCIGATSFGKVFPNFHRRAIDQLA